MYINLKSNYQDLLKCFAILMMIIDHLGLYIFLENNTLRLIGRLAMPIFGFFAGYNFKGTPKLKILILGIILYIITTLLFKNFTTLNILISIFLGQCYIYSYSAQLVNIKHNYLKIFILLLLSLVTTPLFDYGTLVIAVMVLGYIVNNSPKDLKVAVLLSVIFAMLTSMVLFDFSNWQVIVLVLFIILEYLIMTIKNFNDKIYLNINIISRNSLYIYLVHLIILQYIFVRYVL